MVDSSSFSLPLLFFIYFILYPLYGTYRYICKRDLLNLSIKIFEHNVIKSLAPALWCTVYSGCLCICTLAAAAVHGINQIRAKGFFRSLREGHTHKCLGERDALKVFLPREEKKKNTSIRIIGVYYKWDLWILCRYLTRRCLRLSLSWSLSRCCVVEEAQWETYPICIKHIHTFVGGAMLGQVNRCSGFRRKELHSMMIHIMPGKPNLMQSTHHHLRHLYTILLLFCIKKKLFSHFSMYAHKKWNIAHRKRVLKNFFFEFTIFMQDVERGIAFCGKNYKLSQPAVRLHVASSSHLQNIYN